MTPLGYVKVVAPLGFESKRKQVRVKSRVKGSQSQTHGGELRTLIDQMRAEGILTGQGGFFTNIGCFVWQ